MVLFFCKHKAPPMALSTDLLLNAFTKAVQDYQRSQLRMFQEDADIYASPD